MTTILVVADEPWVRNEVHAGLTDASYTLIDHTEPSTVADAAASPDVDLVIVDMQVGAMGGMALTRAVRHATSEGADAGKPVVMLLDRKADEFLAKRAGAAGWVAKPFNSHELAAVISPHVAAITDPTSR